MRKRSSGGSLNQDGRSRGPSISACSYLASSIAISGGDILTDDEEEEKDQLENKMHHQGVRQTANLYRLARG